MDEIDYFTKRDKFKARKDVGFDWNKLKKQKTSKPADVKPPQPHPEKEEKKTIDKINIIRSKYLQPVVMISCLMPLYNLSFSKYISNTID